MKDLKDEKMAEEILHDNLNEHLSIFVNTYPVAWQSEQMLKDWIVNAMKAYHQAKLKEIAAPEKQVEEQEEKPFYYEKDFVEWLSFGDHPFTTWSDVDEKGNLINYYSDEFDIKRWSLDELYQYWLENIKDK